jgi:hypothetical protein
MFWIFLLWIITFVALFRHFRWTPALVIVTLIATVVFLKFNIDQPIPLNF